MCENVYRKKKPHLEYIIPYDMIAIILTGNKTLNEKTYIMLYMRQLLDPERGTFVIYTYN